MGAPARWAAAFCLFFAVGCGAEAGVHRVQRRLQLDPEALDFSQTGLGQTSTRSFSVLNVSLLSTELRLDPPAAPFSVEGIEGSSAFTLEPGESRRWTVRFSPTEPLISQSSLQITGPEGSAELPLSGRGLMFPAPALSARPAALALGLLTYAETATTSITLTNSGDAAATQIAITGPEQLRLTGDPPTELAAGASVELPLSFSGAPLGAYEDRLQISAAELDAPLQIDITAQVELSLGYLRCVPEGIDFGAVARGAQAARSLTCAASGGAIRGLSLEVPAPFVLSSTLSRTALQSGESERVELSFTPAARAGAIYASLLASAQTAEGESRQEVQLSAEVLSPARPDIRAQLSWDAGDSDLDLHLLSPGGSLFSESDAYFQNPAPDWGVAGRAADNPYLDEDNRAGYGPETINLSEAEGGRYGVYVHYYRDLGAGEVTATARVSLDGAEALSIERRLSCGQLWLVAEVDWAGGAGSVRQVDSVQAAQDRSECP